MPPSSRPSLKLTGYSSAEKVEDLIGSYLVDVAHVIETHRGYVLIKPDDEDINLNSSADYEWFERAVVEPLRSAGEQGITATLHNAAAPASP